MSTTTKQTTADELMRLPDDGMRYELIRGELRMMAPAGGQHGRVAMRIGSMLEQHVHTNQLGEVFAAETGFLLARNPDTVRAPDAAFVSRRSLASVQDLTQYVPVPPDLAIEVVSPRDSSSAVEEKSQFWLEHGTQVVLVVDPATETIRIYRDRSSIEVRHPGESVDLHPLVDGWCFDVADVFVKV